MNYKPDGVDFVLFDARVGEWWLQWDDVQDVARQIGIATAPVMGEWPIDYAESVVRDGFKSTWGDFPAEGLVGRPLVDLHTRNGQQVIVKIKTRDF